MVTSWKLELGEREFPKRFVPFEALNCYVWRAEQLLVENNVSKDHAVFFITGDNEVAINQIGRNLTLKGIRWFDTQQYGKLRHLDRWVGDHFRTFLDW